jgi:Domain of unknown function (DUF4328)
MAPQSGRHSKEVVMGQDYQRSFKDSNKLTIWTKRILYVHLVITVIAVISGVLEFQLLNDLKNGVYTSQSQAVADAEVSEIRQGAIGVFQFIMFIVTGILILKWIHRANFNARQLGASDMVANICTFVSEVTEIPLCFIVLAIVRRVHELQVAHQSNQSLETTPATGF